MKKVLIQFSILASLFFSTWFVLSRVEFVDLLNIKQVSESAEQKLGGLFWDTFRGSETVIEDETISKPVEDLVKKICRKNEIDADSLKIHIIKKDEINAFALPGNHLVVYSGLIEACRQPEELCGVLGHELAHMQHHHVMKKLMKETGLTLITAASGSRAGAEVIKKAFRLLSSTAYDRTLESEADQSAVDYLIKAHIDPEPFADFLHRFGEKEKNKEQLKLQSWDRYHPDPEARYQAILKYLKHQSVQSRPIPDSDEWEQMMDELNEM